MVDVTTQLEAFLIIYHITALLVITIPTIALVIIALAIYFGDLSK